MARDRSGVPYTCGLIDSVIDVLRSIESEEINIWTSVQVLEKIRGFNDDLREWGHGEHSRANELAGELAHAEGRISELEEQLADMTAERDSISAKYDELIESSRVTN